MRSGMVRLFDLAGIRDNRDTGLRNADNVVDTRSESMERDGRGASLR